jgi:steroid delta-isomerase-like uncharacterized protein
MSPEENKAIVRRIFEASNTGNPDILEEVIADDIIIHNPKPGQLPGSEGAKQSFQKFHSGFPDVKVTVEHMIAEEDLVMMHLLISATHKGEFAGISPTGKQITITGMEIVRLANGKVVERWSNFDQLGFYRQLGVIELQDVV